MANKSTVNVSPNSVPQEFCSHLIPKGKLVHSGILSPDSKQFYFTISDKSFSKFDVMVSEFKAGKWQDPKLAFFNSEFNEHGTSFSADGKLIYFSSTRPVPGNEVETWKIWRVNLLVEELVPEYVDIPNLRDKLISHPSLTREGGLYFHAGNHDYSALKIYRCFPHENGFGLAEKLPGRINFGTQHCTPFIAKDGSYLIFESKGTLYISNRNDKGEWEEATALNEKINKNNRGNPFVTSDQKFLFYASASKDKPFERWQINWVGFNGAKSNSKDNQN